MISLNLQGNNTNLNFLLEGEETERLIFRKLLITDFEDWLPFYEDPRSTQFWDGLPADPEIACIQHFQRAFERYEKGLGGMNALINKKKPELVGMCGLLIQEVDGLRH